MEKKEREGERKGKKESVCVREKEYKREKMRERENWRERDL